MVAGRGEPDEAAHAVADDHRPPDALLARDREHLVGPGVEGVRSRGAAVAVAGQVDGHDSVLGGEERGDVVPPLGVGRAAVHEHDALTDPACPSAIADPGALDLDLGASYGCASASVNQVGVLIPAFLSYSHA